MGNMCIQLYLFIKCVSYPSSIDNASGWWFGTSLMFPFTGKFIVPTDELIFFRVVTQPPVMEKL